MNSPSGSKDLFEMSRGIDGCSNTHTQYRSISRMQYQYSVEYTDEHKQVTFARGGAREATEHLTHQLEMINDIMFNF